MNVRNRDAEIIADEDLKHGRRLLGVVVPTELDDRKSGLAAVLDRAATSFCLVSCSVLTFGLFGDVQRHLAAKD